MNSNNIVEIKKQFIQTGRLNRKVIKDEIALSWYRCRLNNLDFEKNIVDDGKCEIKLSDNIGNLFRSILKDINRDNYNLIILDKNGLCYDHIIYDEKLEKLTNIDETLIGTNAAAITLKTKNVQEVKFEEHYLKALSAYCSYSIPIKINDEFIGILLVITEHQMNDIEKYQIVDLVLKKTQGITIEESSIHQEDYNRFKLHCHLDKLFLTESSEVKHLNELIENYLRIGMPIYIYGEKNTGKTALGWYIAKLAEWSFNYIDLKNIPKILRHHWVETQLFQNDAIILDNIEYLDQETIKLLTVYTEEKIINKSNAKYNDYNCLNIILLSVYNPKNIKDLRHVNERFLSRLGQQVINTNQFMLNQITEENIETLLKRYPYEFDESFKSILLKMNDIKNIASLTEIIEKSTIQKQKGARVTADDILVKPQVSLKKLNEIEKDHILKVYHQMNENMTLTAEILGIGRSTLYRKLQAYQNDTKEVL